MKLDRNKTVYIIILIVLVFTLSVGCIHIWKKMHNQEKKENALYFYEIKNNEVTLLDRDKNVGTYKCKGNCEIYKKYFNNGIILLKDDEEIYLYDLVNDEKISKSYTDYYFIYNENGTDATNIEYFVVKNKEGKMGVIDKLGSITIDVAYESIGTISNDEISNYSYKNNFIAVKNNNLWGLLSFDLCKGVLDFQYQDIKVSDYNKLAVLEESKWFLVDNNNKKITQNSFDGIDIFKDYNLVSLEKKAFVINDKGEIISNKIDINDGMNSSFENNELLVTIKKGKNNLKYVYDPVNLELKQK